ncbi:MAG: bifunctional 3-hydroxydecanoyl-ACP dehydratase/trans-2-decenoyl-ACP isomerase, partial [Deltaproteobacteria bacterium]|nr:bifunctional 3-hydroxydecanoyl-ACP dehydratase/trans-2-decenoyl-ACP isomerase [Deltaproteobacteria bacterium]
IDIVRFQSLKQAGSSIVIGNGNVFIDDELITTVKKARTGIFKGITYRDYPLHSINSLGGPKGR